MHFEVNYKDMSVGATVRDINSCGGGQNYFKSRMMTNWADEALCGQQIQVSVPSGLQSCFRDARTSTPRVTAMHRVHMA
jgi:hypothetical protein